MRYVFLLIVCTIFYSCFGSNKDAAALPANVERRYTMPLPFSSHRESDNTFYDVKDLSALLSYLDDTSIKSLRLYRGTYTDLSPLAILTELEELSIVANDNLIDLSPLRSLTSLKSLQLLNDNFAESLEPLSALVNLRYLKLWHRDRDYRELLPLQQLETLKLSNLLPTQNLDLTYIAQLYSLKELDISVSFRNMLVNIDRLGDLVNLEQLTLLGVDPMDISWMANLQNLQELTLRSTTIDDISPLAELPNLVSVNLEYVTVQDIAPLLESGSIKSIHQHFGQFYSDRDKDYQLMKELSPQFEERGIDHSYYFDDR